MKWFSETVQERKEIKYINSHLDLEDMKVMISSYMAEKVAYGEVNIIFTDRKNSDVSKNLNISKMQTMLEQFQEVALQWGKKWKDLRNKQHESKQEVKDGSKRMRDLAKALLEE